jgi:hypothetical protein
MPNAPQRTTSSPPVYATDQIMQEALALAAAPSEALRAVAPGQSVAPADRRGRRVVPGVLDVLRLDRNFATKRAWVSGAPIELTRQPLVDDSWTGSPRNSMVSMW